jgi:hypothetical protein
MPKWAPKRRVYGRLVERCRIAAAMSVVDRAPFTAVLR